MHRFQAAHGIRGHRCSADIDVSPGHRCLALSRIFDIPFCIAKFRLCGTDVLLDVALHLLVRAAERFTGNLLHLARSFFDSTFDLVFVDAHGLTPE